MLEFKRNQPSWLSSELTSVVLPESPQVLKYRGMWSDEARQVNEISHSEAELDRLRQEGIGALWIDFYSGFGLEFEKTELERSRVFIAAAHARGLKAWLRIQFGALTAETLLLEESECQNWVQINHAGQNPVIAEDPCFRVRTCYNSEGWLRYIERVCGTAIEFGADAIHLENIGFNAEPDTCKCPICVAAYRDYLRQHYGSQDERTRQAGRERWGHNTFTHVRPPLISPATGISARSPHVEEWIRFKALSLSSALARVAIGIQKRNPECVISTDIFKFSNTIDPESRGIVHDRLLPLLHVATGALPPSASPTPDAERVASSFGTRVPVVSMGTKSADVRFTFTFGQRSTEMQ